MAKMVRSLDIDIIAPQHGALFKGKDMVEQFINWCDDFQCGIGFISELYKTPSA